LPRPFAVRAIALWHSWDRCRVVVVARFGGQCTSGALAVGGHDLSGHPSTEAFVDLLLAHMSLEEKVGQMIQADTASITPAELSAYKLGSILAGGGDAPDGNLRATPQAWLDLADSFYRHHWPILMQRTGRSRFYSGSMPCMVMARSWRHYFPAQYWFGRRARSGFDSTHRQATAQEVAPRASTGRSRRPLRSPRCALGVPMKAIRNCRTWSPNMPPRW